MRFIRKATIANKKLANVPKRIASRHKALVSSDVLDSVFVRRELSAEVSSEVVCRSLAFVGPASAGCKWYH